MSGQNGRSGEPRRESRAALMPLRMAMRVETGDIVRSGISVNTRVSRSPPGRNSRFTSSLTTRDRTRAKKDRNIRSVIHDPQNHRAPCSDVRVPDKSQMPKRKSEAIEKDKK